MSSHESGSEFAVEVREVSVRFGGVKALDRASMRLRPHEVAGLIGPNGAGKSTLVGVIAGTVRPDSGSVRLIGREVRSSHVRSRAKHGLARTFQHPALFQSLTVQENLEFGRSLRRRAGRTLSSPQQRFCDELVEQLGVTAWLDTRVDDAPHPVQRLVETARAMLCAAPALLVDEPAAGLTEAAREALVEALKSYRNVFGASVLVVEHDVPLVLATCDRITVLHEGMVLADATPDEIRRDQRVIDAYFGSSL
jgi:branched-chain amino acid transport system ATP-binding protein